jgi:hypothetical protein
MAVLALDLGVTTGWARSNGQSGAFSVKGIPDHGQALAMFSDWIDGMLDEAPLVYLAVERGFGGNNAVGRLTTAMELTAHAAAYARQVPRTDRSAVTVRKWLLGYARVGVDAEPSKAARVRLLDKAVMAGVRARGFSPANEHAADAAALLCCVEERPLQTVAA